VGVKRGEGGEVEGEGRVTVGEGVIVVVEEEGGGVGGVVDEVVEGGVGWWWGGWGRGSGG
ncbi:hypothetical protein, partial [Dermacoccus nishinomiyaensis]|uniref:hypothetical protein n=1 Tax=Dermacoccus nishinomiyaensis TaxID=1274 RepID=UPI001C92F090